MRLSQSLFEIEGTVVVPKIEDFIRKMLAAFSRKGILVPLSGGLDSSTVAALCARAVGKENVTGLMLPDIKGSPEAVQFGRLIAKDLGIRAHSINMTHILLAAGAYRFAANLVPSRKLLSIMVRRHLRKSNRNLHLEALRGSNERMILRALASVYARQRARVVVTFRYADLHQLLVVGTAHKSEDLLGLYVKFGIDDSADLMPLKNLYRSHILQIARYVGIPQSILERSPNPEMLPGVEDKYYDLFGMESEKVDLVLFGIESQMSNEEIATDTGVAMEKVTEIREVVALSQYMRQPSMTFNPLAT
jgi:NAD+ synthase